MNKDTFKLRLFNLLMQEQVLEVKGGIDEEVIFHLIQAYLHKLKLAEDVLATLNFKIYEGNVITNDSWLRQTNPEVYNEIMEKRNIESAQRKNMGIDDE